MKTDGLPHNAWVVVADGEKALVLVNDGDDQDMNLNVRRKTAQDNPPARDWASDKAGRFNDGAGVQKSAVENTDWHVLEKERFASDLAAMLYKAAHRGAFERIAIVASRVVLSALRKEMHQEVADRVILEVPKVLTNHPMDQIEDLVARELAQRT